MPKDPVLVKTIVTVDLAERIAEHYGVETRNVLTGFKYIGEQIGLLEKTGEEKRYLFGFEESYGYLTGTYVRDKDGVDGAVMICEMFSFYAARGIRQLGQQGIPGGLVAVVAEQDVDALTGQHPDRSPADAVGAAGYNCRSFHKNTPFQES